MMEKFGGYGFNKAHSDAYSKVTMQTAWLATYYPLEFYAALLTKGQSGEMQDYVSDIKRAGIKVLPVNINESKFDHSVQEKAVRLSLKTVLGVGKSNIDKIVADQPYEDWFDFIGRCKASKTAVEPLIAAGAFDTLDKNMKQVELWYDVFLKDTKYKSKKWDEYKQICNDIKPEDYTLAEKVALENALMGFSVRGSPFEILDRKKKISAVFEDAIVTYKEFVESTDEMGMIPVCVKDFKERPQRNGQMFAFIKFATDTGEEFECPAFSTIWKHIKTKVHKGAVYIATFNKKADDPESFILGRPGWAQSAHSAMQCLINVDEITL
jgi:DNA polymerase-3 subunit alpha